MIWLDANKTYIAAIGLIGLAIYDFSIGNYYMAAQCVLAGFAFAGLHSKMAKVNS